MNIWNLRKHYHTLVIPYLIFFIFSVFFFKLFYLGEMGMGCGKFHVIQHFKDFKIKSRISKLRLQPALIFKISTLYYGPYIITVLSKDIGKYTTISLLSSHVIICGKLCPDLMEHSFSFIRKILFEYFYYNFYFVFSSFKM